MLRFLAKEVGKYISILGNLTIAQFFLTIQHYELHATTLLIYQSVGAFFLSGHWVRISDSDKRELPNINIMVNCFCHDLFGDHLYVMTGVESAADSRRFFTCRATSSHVYTYSTYFLKTNIS